MSHRHFDPDYNAETYLHASHWSRVVAVTALVLLVVGLLIWALVASLQQEEPVLEGYKRVEVDGRPYILMWGTDRHTNPFTTVVPDPDAL